MSSRFHQAPPIETDFVFRAASDGSTTFEGYTAIFNVESKPMMDEFARGKPYTETIEPGAFRRSLGTGSRISFVVDHDERQMISSFPSGPLRLAEDSTGLHIESPWPRTSYADNVRALHEAGEKLGMSINYAFPRSGPEAPKWNAANSHRSVPQALIRHASVLATMEPAFDGTTASFRALADQVEADMDDLEALFEALRSGRDLSDAERNLLTRLAAVKTPEAGESAQAEESTDEAGRAVLDRWTDRLAQIDAELPTS